MVRTRLLELLAKKGDASQVFADYLTDFEVPAGSIGTSELADEAVTLAKSADLARGSIISGQTANNRPTALDVSTDGGIIVGDGTDVNVVTMSGDATLSNAGALTIAQGAVEDSMIEGLAAGEFIVGVDGTAANNAKVTVSGDATMTGAGVMTVTGSTGPFSVGTTFTTGSTTTSSGPGAVAITGMIHEITTTGTGDALTLADGAEGQWLAVVYAAEGAGSDTAVLTPTNLAGSDTTITFTDIGDTAYLLFTNGAWQVMGRKGINFAASEVILAEGNLLVGNSSGVATALDIGNTDGGVAIGNGTTATIASLSGDVTMTNAGVTTVGAIDLETATITNIADTEFMVGDGAGSAAFVSMSGDATMANTGAVTIANNVIDNANIDPGAGIVVTKLEGLANGEFLIGVDGAAVNNSKVTMSGDGSLANDGTFALTSLDLETATVTNIADTEIMVGDGAGSAAFVSVSGDATLANTGALTVTAVGDSAWQRSEVGVTATADGLTTGIIATGTAFVTVTSADANNIITLPSIAAGTVIRVATGGTGCEVRTPSASNEQINGVDCDGSNELALDAGSLYEFVAMDGSNWVARGWSSAGADKATLVPDAA